jgi:hypothetical protein
MKIYYSIFKFKPSIRSISRLNFFPYKEILSSGKEMNFYAPINLSKIKYQLAIVLLTVAAVMLLSIFKNLINEFITNVVGLVAIIGFISTLFSLPLFYSFFEVNLRIKRFNKDVSKMILKANDFDDFYSYFKKEYTSNEIGVFL